LRSIDKFIRTNYRLPHDDFLIVLYEDNSACVTQMQVDFVKGDQTKYIDPKYFSYIHDFIIERALEIKKVISVDNLVDLFTKALPLCVHRRLVHDSGMQRLNIFEQDIQ